MILDLPDLRHRIADLPGVQLHYVEAGEGPLVILLHGFPEFWYSWRFQIGALADAGFRVVAPDMRGYNRSDKPKGVAAYSSDTLADDIHALTAHLEAPLHGLVGHDWGGGVAWFFAMKYPEAFQRLAILNCPHPARFLTGLRTLRQLRKSWYMFFFQLPWLPEAVMKARDFAAIRKVFRDDPERKDSFTEEDINAYVRALSAPGALTGAINYYRAAFRQAPWTTFQKFQVIHNPVQVLWGVHDRHLGEELASPPPDWVPNAQVELCADASHWLMTDQPEWVNAHLTKFLSEA